MLKRENSGPKRCDELPSLRDVPVSEADEQPGGRGTLAAPPTRPAGEGGGGAPTQGGQDAARNGGRLQVQ
jgi:hypothetical protein